MNERIFFVLFGAAIACVVVLGMAWGRDRRRLARLEDRLLDGPGRASGAQGDLEERVNELAGRVTQLARGQEFLQQFLSGQRRLPQTGKTVETNS